MFLGCQRIRADARQGHQIEGAVVCALRTLLPPGPHFLGISLGGGLGRGARKLGEKGLKGAISKVPILISFAHVNIIFTKRLSNDYLMIN